MSIFDTLLSVFFPDRCVGCGVRGTLFCEVCSKRIAPPPAPADSFITSVFSYNDPRVKRLVKLLKYKNTRHAAALFAPYLAEALTEFLGEERLFVSSKRILLVPIPLSKKRARKRGYNQAELLARAMIKLLPKETVVLETKILKKIVETKPQAEIKKKNIRLHNLGECFAVVPGHTGAGETVILVDDVTTTGATLAVARRALSRAGFRSVYAVTVAH